MKISNGIGALLIALALNVFAAAQIKGRIETIVKSPPAAESGKKCADFKAGRLVALPQADYPAGAKAARVGGTVVINLKLNEKGTFSEILSIEGNNLLHGAVAQAARRVKFSPSICDGAPVTAIIVLFYNFTTFSAGESYFKPAKIEDFADVKNDSPFYEAILNLTENYRLAHGYADRKFYADAPLTKGDFAEFLRRTLDLLAQRAADSGKMPRQINLFHSLNSRNLKSVAVIKDFSEKDAFAESVKVLLLTYDIELTDERLEFNGENALTKREVVELWTRVFDAEAIPVNFADTASLDAERIMTRGEFALFLQESLNVLAYKVLP